MCTNIKEYSSGAELTNFLRLCHYQINEARESVFHCSNQEDPGHDDDLLLFFHCNPEELVVYQHLCATDGEPERKSKLQKYIDCVSYVEHNRTIRNNSNDFLTIMPTTTMKICGQRDFLKLLLLILWITMWSIQLVLGATTAMQQFKKNAKRNTLKQFTVSRLARCYFAIQTYWCPVRGWCAWNWQFRD